jgi:enamine deaminase RidA (YjgF/YER057c/UK114 family)
MTEFISPDTLPTPPGYSQIAVVPAGTRLVYISGQVGMRPDGKIVLGMEAQTRLTFENLGHALDAAGASWGDVVKLTYFVLDVRELPVIREVRNQFVDTERPPASSLFQVPALFLPDVLIEVEAIASVGGETSRD